METHAMKVLAAGYAITPGPEGTQEFTKIKAAALQEGYYEGKSLEPGQGGRFAMMVDELQIKHGYSEAKAKAIAAKIARNKYGNPPVYK